MNKGYLLVFLATFISGLSIFINKFGVSLSNPYVYTFLRVAIVAFILSALLLFSKEREKIKKIRKKDWLLLMVVGFVGGSIPFLLFFKGLTLTTAAQGSFIHKTMFVWVAILSYFFLKEKIDKNFFLGGLILLFANVLILKKFPHSLNEGDFLVFLATLLWSIENTLSKYLLKSLEAKIVAWGRMFFGAIFIFLFLLSSNQLSFIFKINSQQIFWVLITSFLLLGYVLSWYSGLKLIPVSIATVILLLGSPITTLLFLINTGKINFQEILSGFLIILGTITIIGFKKTWTTLREIKINYART